MFGKKEKIKVTIQDVEIEGSIDQVFKVAKKFKKVNQGLHNFAQHQQMQQRQLPPAQQDWGYQQQPVQNPQHQMQQQPMQQNPHQPMRQPHQDYNYPQYPVPPVQHNIPVADEAISLAPKTTKKKASKKPQEVPSQPMPQPQMKQVPDELPELNIPPKGKTKVQL